MADVNSVNQQLADVSDKRRMYAGAGGTLERDEWTVRDFTGTLATDLTRFQSPGEDRFKGNIAHVDDANNKWGLRDQITRMHRLLELIAAHLNIQV